MNEQNTHPSGEAPKHHNSGGSPLKQLESWLEEYLGHKAPQLPEKWRETLVKIIPWITLIIMVLALPVILFALGIGTFVAPFAFYGGLNAGGMYMVGMILSVVSIVLEVMALPGLFKRSMQGWRFAYYASLVTAISAIVMFNFSSLIGVIIGLYILFQIKKLYR